MDMDLFQIARKNCEEGTPFAFVTITHTAASSPRKAGAKMIVYPDGEIEGTIGGGTLEANVIEEAREALKEGKNREVEYTLEPEGLGMYCGGEARLFIDVFRRDFQLIQFGGGHCGRAVARIAELTDRPYVIVDDREEFANRDLYPLASRVVCSDFESVFDKLDVDENTYISIMTRGHAADEIVLKQALKTDACYIGMIGSKSKVIRLCKEIQEEIGQDPLADPRVYTPVGLEFGTSHPGDIAVSLWAEILKIRTSSSGEHMRAEA